MKKLRLRALSLAAAAALLLPAFPAQGADLEVTAPSAVLMEASTGQVLFEKDPHAVRSCASITKVMTLCLVFEAIDSGRLSWTRPHRLGPRRLYGGFGHLVGGGGGHVCGRSDESHRYHERQRRCRGAGRGCLRQRGRLCGADEPKGPGAWHERHVFKTATVWTRRAMSPAPTTWP